MRSLLFGFAAVALAAVLGGCGTTLTDPETGVQYRVEGGVGDFLDNLATATRADAVNALALAEQAGNQDWARCWTTVIGVLDEKGAGDSRPVAVVGPLSGLQKASNVYRAVDDGLDPRVRADCAVVALDVARFFRRSVRRFLPLL